MRNSGVQMSLFDTYKAVSESMEQKKPELIALLEEHIDYDSLIPAKFKWTFYRPMGRGHVYQLESIIRALTIQKLFGIPTDALLILILKCCRELREFCSFVKVGVYSMLPEASETNPDARQQHINGHFCYAAKVGILVNGLGIPRHIAFFDYSFRKRHPEVAAPKSDNPDLDKEIADSISLKPVLSDFFHAHPHFSYGTFRGDSAFDSYDTYAMLKNEFGFRRACIPLNERNSKSSSACFDCSGTPVCPVDGIPFTYLGKSGGKKRSLRFKWVCHKSMQVGSRRVCTCEHPCTDSSYGKCVYTYPDKNFRLYPGIPRNTEHWDNLYRHRVLVERNSQLMKDAFVLDSRKSFRSASAKADAFLVGIVQLIGVILADALHKPQYYKSLRALIA